MALLLNTFLRQVVPSHQRTTLAVHANYELTKVVDALTMRSLPSLTVRVDPTGSYYLEDGSQWGRGCLLSLRDVMTLFPSHRVAHCTMKSARFDRLTLVAYTARNFLSLAPQWRQELAQRGFPVSQ